MADFDSDSFYTTNQKDIVAHAKMCYEKYPTIVNKIEKESKKYNNTMIDYARMDNALSASQADIGESSNLAQIAQTYSYNFNDAKFDDYVCSLSVLAQVAIDNSKRKFDVDLTQSIKNIKADMNIKENKYPLFWRSIKPNFNQDYINTELNCPMNYLAKLRVPKFKSTESTLPNSYFFVKHELDINRKKCKRVEEMIQKYSLDILNSSYATDRDDYILLRNDFDDLISDICKVKISGNYVGLFSWLIDRAFLMTPDTKHNRSTIQGTMNNNKALLLKTLYAINPKALLKCFK